MPKYIVLLAQAHETFRKPELEALAELEGLKVDLSGHDEKKPVLVVDLENEEQARLLIKRSILARGIYELWGFGQTWDELHEHVRKFPASKSAPYKNVSFKFDIISFQKSRSTSEQRDIMESFGYMDLTGPIRMKKPDETFAVIELYNNPHVQLKSDRELEAVYLGRFIANSQRDIIDKYDLKKRKYIGTTSFDAELALISSNIGLAAPGKIIYDPFAGTGSFLVAASHFGALAIGSDIDGRQIRGKKKHSITTNYKQYGLTDFFLDVFVGDFTHNPIRPKFKLDAIICDPPYGVREGLKVLGSKNPERYADKLPTKLENGDLSHLRPDYIPPKKPYHFDALLDDLLDFASVHLIDNGRLCCWMPTANEDYGERMIPQHPELELISTCVQEFNKWSRVLLVYVRRPRTTDGANLAFKDRRIYREQFRDKYFRGFHLTSKDDS
ncbi:S-adenosyl-L-methionine-dependent methyltransferase [Lipomyces japonicus]|uniref:S-adenosyl-L-methionine-dependent methyltransferase n=1 Tax=Lipomyces japonicus TaxID=56871 RepID=UPI0034CFF0FB